MYQSFDLTQQECGSEATAAGSGVDGGAEVPTDSVDGAEVGLAEDADEADEASGAAPVGEAGFWLHQAALAWRAALDVRLRPLGLTPTQFLLLSAAARLERTAGPATQQEVAEHAGADRMMTSKVLRALEDRGLLTRAAHERDARAVRVSLTAAGHVLATAAAGIAAEFDSAFFGAAAGRLARELRAVARDRGRSGPPSDGKDLRTHDPPARRGGDQVRCEAQRGSRRRHRENRR